MAVADICPTCGRPLSGHDVDYRFRLPDLVLDTPEREQAPGIWITHPDPTDAFMMTVPGVGAFVRALLPVRLAGGFTVMFGVWIQVAPDVLDSAKRVWFEPEYADLVLDGILANTLPVWGLLGAPVSATVKDTDEAPYCSSSTDPQLGRVLNEEWPHDEILGALDSSDSDGHSETAAYVCVHVLEGTRDVLLVAHDEDDAWSFQCGEAHVQDGSKQEYFVVGVNHLLDRDPTLRSVLDLDLYEEAEREKIGGEWTRAPFEPEQ